MEQDPGWLVRRKARRAPGARERACLTCVPAGDTAAGSTRAHCFLFFLQLTTK